MNIDFIVEKFKDRESKLLENKRQYAVLLPLIKIEGHWHIIYERRAKNLSANPGEVSFPGGGLEGLESFEEAAIRETMEELCIERENIEVLGKLDLLVSYANFLIQPFVGIISGINVDKIRPNKDEVDYIFTVPLEYLLENEPEKYNLDLQTVGSEEFPYYLIPNGKDYSFRSGKHSVLFYQCFNEIIWGHTAAITRNFIDIIKDLD